ncbi:CarboxypepD_reg-like domain-containing protein [Flexibacter flexilis DSM 6793]|uniref:CarboxypepD_reg-like domain-containing protein n=1 Tax=Flexibacter flexilis DSM 6793 TaxID=927664 RepID=A0A1I1GTE3_9BACT|nr:carboxypeptidase-like regulatory domain-containing protein [Flexibacter flexilis]SFC14781.1 CarboxypepD_reg-like domain-containing protein [Flexibacter flexilis DSM 6793]
MKKQVSAIGLLLLSGVAFAQNASVISKQIIDYQDKKGVPYATVNVKHTQNATYSNEQGIFSISCLPTDTLHFSSVGYEPTDIVASQVLNQQNILLRQATITLQEVVITNQKPQKTKSEWLGYAKRKGNSGYIGFQEAAVWIANPYKRPLPITSVRCIIEKKRNGWIAPNNPTEKGKMVKLTNEKLLVRLRFYTKDVNGFPIDEDILKQNEVAEVPTDQAFIDFDLRDLSLDLSKYGAFVALEYLGIVRQNTNEFVPYDKLTMLEKQQFHLKLVKDKKIKDDSFARDFWGKWGKAIIPGNFCFSIELEIPEE